MFHQPNWTPLPDEAFRAHVEAFLSEHDAWIIDGNYDQVQDLVLKDATTVIWLRLTLRSLALRYEGTFNAARTVPLQTAFGVHEGDAAHKRLSGKLWEYRVEIFGGVIATLILLACMMFFFYFVAPLNPELSTINHAWQSYWGNSYYREHFIARKNRSENEVQRWGDMTLSFDGDVW